jgi:bacterioferritin-associated ferredoxin
MYIISIHIYNIYIILFLAYYYTPYGDINDIILMGYLSILFCSAKEMENEPRREYTAMQDVEVADGRWIGCGYGIWQRLKIRPLYICIYICTCSGVSSDNVGLLTAQHVQFLSEPYLYSNIHECRCCRNEWLFSVCTSRLRIEFQASLNFV